MQQFRTEAQETLLRLLSMILDFGHITLQEETGTENKSTRVGKAAY